MTAQGEGAAASPLQAVIDKGAFTPVQILVVALCTFVAVAEGIDLNMIPLLAGAIRADWGLPSSAFGAIFAAGPIGLIIGGASVGYFSDRFGRRWALIGAMLVMTAATVATAFVTDVPELLVCRVLTGIGFGGIVPVTSTMVSEFVPTRARASIVALVILGQAAGGLFAALLMKTAIADAPWQTLILYAAALCAVTTLVILALLPESPRYLLLKHAGTPRLASMLRRLRIADAPDLSAAAEGGERRNRFLALFTEGRALGTALLWAIFIGICAPVSFLTSWIALIYTYADKPAAAGVSASAAYWAGGIAGGLVLPIFCRWWHVNKVLMAVILGGALSVAGLGSVLTLGDTVNLAMAFVTGVFISGAFYMMYPPAVHFYPTAIRSTGVGSAVAFGRIGNTVSPAVAGLLLAGGFGPGFVFGMMALPLLLSFAALVGFDRLTARG
ncbi:MAG: MFS transporter [Sphingomonas sp.]